MQLRPREQAEEAFTSAGQLTALVYHLNTEIFSAEPQLIDRSEFLGGNPDTVP